MGLYYSLDVARVDAQTISEWNSADGDIAFKWNSYDFGWELALSLARPMMQQRMEIGGLQGSYRIFNM